MRVLIVYENAEAWHNTRSTICVHLNALKQLGEFHEVICYNARDTPGAWSNLNSTPEQCPAALRGTRFDAVILHYTFLSYCTIGTPFFMWKRKFAWIAEMPCLKIAIPQDECDFAAVLDEWLLELEVSVILSVHYSPDGPLYPLMRNRAVIQNCLPGYIDDETAKSLNGQVKPIGQRSKDLVYRARRLSYRFGRAGRTKYLVGDVVAQRARPLGLDVDISTQAADAIYGPAWLQFLSTGNVVVGSPGGYSAIDYRGELRAQTERILQDDPQISFEEFDRRMPPGWDDFRLLTITPRHFEAVMTKTCQMLVEGDYKGVLEPDHHYISLKPDFSNLDQALELVRDRDHLQATVDRTYDDICRSGRYTYATFVKQIDAILKNFLQPQNRLARSMNHQESSDKAIAALERELVAARHENLLVQARMKETSEDLLHSLARRVADETAQMILARLHAAFNRILKRVLIIAGVFVVILGLLLSIWLLNT